MLKFRRIQPRRHSYKTQSYEKRVQVFHVVIILWARTFFTITAEILARSLANFCCQYADRHMNLKFMRRVSE